MRQVRCVSIIWSILWDIIMWKQHLKVKFIFVFIHALCVDNTGQFMHGSFIVLVPKQKRPKTQLGQGAPGRYGKLVFCPVSLI